ncbi:hypothetical protein DPMN_173075 [Dreissena polymorpha]|uniref:AXH domain-containing protein n=2 Tax=Dreissena polymorpha TaxID=45954 RepID=A0A9D4E2R3_DREPO|nr:hypothetical protein DPMN_173075 [Dreissena polymorpha]
MTGSSAGGGNSNLHRLTDGSGAQGQAQPQVAAAEGMILGRVGSSGSLALHEHLNTRSIVTGSVGAGPPVTASIHAPQTLSDTQRYRATYSPTGAGSSAVGPYSPLYTGGSHGTGPAYGAYYGQYTTGGMQGAIDPHIGHYSAVLQSIGNAAQSQVPRSPYPASSGLIHPFSIPASVPAQKGYGSGLMAHERDELRYKREHESESQRRYSTGVLKDEKAHQFTFPSGFAEPSRAPVSSTLRESPSQRREHEYYNYKVPSSRDGNIRQRMSRPSDATSSFPTENPHSAFKNTDEPSAKRTKIEHTGGDVSMERQVPESVLKYPHHFMKGSIIELGNRKLKRVEDLETNDFINSADISSDLKIDSSTVVHISENETQGTSVLGFVVGEHKVQVTIEAPVEHPFFVFGKGWSSCEPSWTMKRYELECQKLVVGDRCISLTHKEVTAHAAEISKQQKQQNRLEGNSIFDNKDLKSLGSPPKPRDSPRQSPYQGQSKSPAGSANLQGQGHRSESGGHTEQCSSMGVKSEHNLSNLSNPVGLCQMTSSGHPQEHGNNSSTPS